MMLKNKVALITGGSKGLGFAIAQALAKNGAKIMTMNLFYLKQKATKDHLYTILMYLCMSVKK